MSLAFLFYNFLGLLPSKFIYGFVYDFGTGKNSSAAMATIMLSPTITVLAYYLVGYLIIRNDVLKYEEPNPETSCSCCKLRCLKRFSFCSAPSVKGGSCSRLSCLSCFSCFKNKKAKE
jgi:hypothetical protein